MLDIESTIIVIVSLVALALLSAWLVWRRQRAKLDPPIAYTRRPPKVAYFFRELDKSPSFYRRRPKLSEQSEDWQQAMRRVGQCLDEHEVSHVYFTHGTFVGFDPFGVLPAMRRLYPKMSLSQEEALRARIKRGFDKLSQDTGNYLPDYVELFAKASDCKASCQLFNWSSGNHHLARLLAAIDIIERLLSDLPDIPASRVLLVGHSHAGQIFALSTHLIQLSPLGHLLWDFASDHRLLKSETLKRRVRRLKKFRFDYVTFGSPLRYPWRLNEHCRLLQVVNHRGQHFLASKLLGFWNTAGGDYVHLWGITGSDSPAASASERELNRQLDRLLGVGIDPRGWLDNMRKGMRVSNHGTTFLVDYKDNNLLVPNGMATMFGHGTYTRFEHLLFNSRLICDVLYAVDKRNFVRAQSHAKADVIAAPSMQGDTNP